MTSKTKSHAGSKQRPALIGYWAVAAFTAMVLAQIALPLVPEHAPALVTLVVSTLAVASYLFATSSWQPKRILAAVLVAPVGFGIELLGDRLGFPFGDYFYSEALQPQLLEIPLVIPLAWAAMTLAAWEIGRRATSIRPLQWLVGGLAITAWDLFLDPLMTSYDYWIWDGADPGPAWQGIPLTNFAGWVLVGTALCALVDRLLGPAGPNDRLAALYVWMTGFSALGFLLPFAFDRPMAGIVVMLASAPLIYLALRPRTREWLGS